MVQLTLTQLVQQVDDLPILPQVAGQVLRLVDDPTTEAAQLQQVIIRDQSLTTKLLRLANSAYYGAPRQIITIEEAVILLGMKSTRDLVMAASLSGPLQREVPGYLMQEGELWQHSLGCAVAARIIAARYLPRQAEQAFVAGLLHDIGKLILHYYLRESWEAIKQLVEEGHPFMEAEMKVLGFDHAQVGGVMGEKWNLPPVLVASIAGHHNPRINNQERPAPLTAVVHLADAICLMLGLGLGIDGLAYPVDEAVLGVLGLTEQPIELLLAEVQQALETDTSLMEGL